MSCAARVRVLAVAVLALASAPAQDDLRDVVTTRAGESLRCRVLALYEPDGLTVKVGKRGRQLPLADVAAVDTVRTRTREFFGLLDRLPGNLKHRWFMAQWAADRELHDLARLTALDVVLRAPDHEGAHTLLGHRRRRGEWLWPCDGEWKTFAALQAVRADWQHGWCIAGECFQVQSNAELRRVVDALWDLERFHVVWFDRFGGLMQLHEVLGPKLEVRIWRDAARFPGQRTVPGGDTEKNPFFFPGGGVDGMPAVSSTYFGTADAARPTRLFEAATSHLLHATVADRANYNSGYRPAAWGELGLARYLERSMVGPPGAAALGAWRIEPEGARLVLAHPERDLPHVSRYDSKKYWGGVSDDNVFEWAAAELAVAFVLEAPTPAGLRTGFGGYMREVLRQVKGTSSSALDRHLGRPIEQLDGPWRAWLGEQLQPRASGQ